MFGRGIKMGKEEICFTEGATLEDFIESFRKTSMLVHPKVVKVSVVFRDADTGEIEERNMIHKSYDE